MIKTGFIQKQIEKYKKIGKAPPILAQIFFKVLSNSIERHYGSPKGDKCLQYSTGVSHLLWKFGINSKLLIVEVRAIESKVDAVGNFRIGGFEGQNHHIICFSEFNELIDFSIHFLNIHPKTSDPANALAPPAMWWNGEDPKILEPAISYKPIGELNLALPADEQKDLENFISIVDEVFPETLREYDIQTFPKEPILHDFETFKQLALQTDNPWIDQALIFLTTD